MSTRSHTALLAAVLVVMSSLSNGGARAQQAFPRTIRVALFVPLWLDSAFTETGEFRYGKGFPRQSIPGLEFYQGVTFALDTLRDNGKADIDLRVFDIRSREGAVPLVTRMPLMDSLDLIIGQVSGTDYLRLAETARARRIPFLSASYPNDGGVRENPYLFISNARLQTHLQVLQSYLKTTLGPAHNALWLRRTLPADDRLADAFRELEGAAPPKYRTTALVDTFSERHLMKLMDSTRINVLIAGSLDEAFGLRLVNQCLAIDKAYRLVVVGMPTWEALTQLRSTRYRSIPIEHTVSFHRPAIASWGDRMEEEYRRRTFSRPSDVAFKAFQGTYHFVSLLLRQGGDWAGNLNDPQIRAVTDLDYQPVRFGTASSTPDYYENKRIYLVRREEGMIYQLR
jgi:hypothetical protein